MCTYRFSAPAYLAHAATLSLLAAVLTSAQTQISLPSPIIPQLVPLPGGDVPLPSGNGSETESVTSCLANRCLARTGAQETLGRLDLSSYGCFCDKECVTFGDCCPDAAWSATASEEVDCHYVDGAYVYMVSQCPKSWPDDATRRDCEAKEEDVSFFEDPLAALPVTSLQSEVTYRNAACARCHEDTDTAMFWSSLVDCAGARQNAASNNILATLQQNEEGHWGVTVSEDGVESFHRCSLKLQLPQRLRDGQVRGCLPSVSDCAPDWNEAETAAACGAYTSRVLDTNWTSERAFRYYSVYRNMHCALCNHVPLQTLSCGMLDRYKPNLASYDSPVYQTSFSFSILLDISDRSGSDAVGVVKVCDDGELWDPFFHKCRRVFCDAGQILEEGVCRPKMDASGGSDNSTTVNSTESSHFQFCPKFYLSADEFETRDDGSVYVLLYDQLYKEGEFELRDDELAVCSRAGDFSKFDDTLGIVSLVFVVVSMLCLCCHLVLFSLVPSQRNLPGKNLAALCVCLLLAYVCFVAAPFQETNTAGCRALGVIMYAAFIASFCWMNVMAFDVFISLRSAMVELRVNTGERTKRFLLYALYSFSLAGVLVAAAVSVDTSESVPLAYRPGFGERVCWFSRRRALLVFFAMPLLVIMVANVILFVGSARIVRQAARSAATVTSCAPNKTNLKLYCRLAVLSGLSWALGLAAGWLDFQPLWHIFVVLNTLQGVFIFITFTMSSRQRTQVRQRASRWARWQAAGGARDGADTGTEGGEPTPETGETQI